jgi:GNAT superfamily N-acetyltransferase
MVELKLQNRGIGTLLMKAVEQYFVLEVKRYELFTGHKSIGNLHLYQKLGYWEFKRIHINDALAMVFMEKYTSR